MTQINANAHSVQTEAELLRVQYSNYTTQTFMAIIWALYSHQDPSAGSPARYLWDGNSNSECLAGNAYRDEDSVLSGPGPECCRTLRWIQIMTQALSPALGYRYEQKDLPSPSTESLQMERERRQRSDLCRESFLPGHSCANSALWEWRVGHFLVSWRLLNYDMTIKKITLVCRHNIISNQ